MTEFDLPSSTTTTTNAKANPIDSYFPGITLSDFVLLSSCFIIFFYSSSLFRIFSFFVPLLVTTILLLFAAPRCSEGDALLDQRRFEELQVFKIVFEEPMIVEAIRRLDDLDDLPAPQGLGESGDQAADGEGGIPVGVPAKIAQERGSEGEEETIEVSQGVIVEANAACCVESEKLTQCGMEKVQALPIGLFANHVVQESMGESIMSGRESEATASSSSEKGKSDDQDRLGSHLADHDTTCFEGESPIPASSNLTMSERPIRKEREWRRTLACKLFEDRHSGGAGNEDGMDSLWEVHESKESTTMGKPDHNDHVTNNEDEDDDGFVGEKVCCLQALKLSAGRRMGRPNITTVSKLLKRIGWLRNSKANWHRKR